VDLDYKATEDLAEMAIWSQDSLEYAREHGQRKLIWLLEAVRVEVKLEDALLTIALREHLVGSERGVSSGREKVMHKHQGVAEMSVDDLARQAAQERKREQAEARSRAQQAAVWDRFMQEELREMELRKGGQLARLLGEPLPGEPPAALEQLALEDQKQAQEGLVALMSGGKVSYKHLDELSEKDMPARIAANRLRTTWLKERQDGWLSHRGDSL
jgi:hypothetical protein